MLRRYCVHATVLAIGLSASALGADKNWTNTTDADTWWHFTNNWFPASMPGANDNAIIVSRVPMWQTINYANSSGGNFTLHDLQLKTENTGHIKFLMRQDTPDTLKTTYDWIYSQGFVTFRQEAGTHTVAQQMSLGYAGTTGRATYELTGGTISNAGTAQIGGSGLADFNQTGGTHTANVITIDSPDKNLDRSNYSLYGGAVNAATLTLGQYGAGSFDHGAGSVTAGSIYLGDGSQSTGYYQIFGGATLTSNAYTFIGNSGQGQFRMFNGTANLSSLFIGRNAGSNGSWQMDLGNVTTTLAIVGDGGVGSFFQNDGFHQTQTLRIGGSFGAQGSYYLSNPGSLSVSNYMSVGSSGTGQFMQAGGRTNIAGNLIIGEYGTGHGVMTFGGGTLNVTGVTSIGSPFGGGGGGISGGLGSLSISSGTANLTGGFRIGEGTGAEGSLLISGGTVNTGTSLIGINGGKGTLQLTDGRINVNRILTVGSGTGSIGTINLNGASALFSGSGGSIILGSGGGVGVVNLTSGFLAPGNRLTINSGSTFNMSGGTFYGSITDLTGGTFKMTGGWAGLGAMGGIGNVQINNAQAYIFNGSVRTNVAVGDGGTLTLDNGIGNKNFGPSTFHQLTVGTDTSNQYTATIDITDDGFVLNYDPSETSPLANVKRMIKSGYNNGAWNGKGIISTQAQPDSTHGIGYAEASQLFGTFPAMFFRTLIEDDTNVLAAYTYLGDANIDGKVDVSDLGRLATNWQTSNRDWVDGDFNYDGVVNVSDLGALATNWQAGVSGPAMSFDQALASVGLSGATVPEPAAVIGLTSLAGLLLRRRR